MLAVVRLPCGITHRPPGHQYQWLVDNPDKMPGAVEEILRFNPSFMHMRRTAMEDIELSHDCKPPPVYPGCTKP